MAFDSAGNLLISGISEVRAVAGATGTSYHQAMTAGDIYTIAGNGTYGYTGDGGAAPSAELRQPKGRRTTRGPAVLAFSERVACSSRRLDRRPIALDFDLRDAGQIAA